MNIWTKSCLVSFSGDFIFRNFTLTMDRSNFITSSIFQLYLVSNAYFQNHTSQELTQIVYGHFLYDLTQSLIIFDDEERTRTLNLYYLICCFSLEKFHDMPTSYSTLLSLFSYVIKNVY